MHSDRARKNNCLKCTNLSRFSVSIRIHSIPFGVLCILHAPHTAQTACRMHPMCHFLLPWNPGHRRHASHFCFRHFICLLPHHHYRFFLSWDLLHTRLFAFFVPNTCTHVHTPIIYHWPLCMLLWIFHYAIHVGVAFFAVETFSAVTHAMGFEIDCWKLTLTIRVGRAAKLLPMHWTRYITFSFHLNISKIMVAFRSIAQSLSFGTPCVQSTLHFCPHIVEIWNRAALLL